jgi:hypothetical protein
MTVKGHVLDDDEKMIDVWSSKWKDPEKELEIVCSVKDQ